MSIITYHTVKCPYCGTEKKISLISDNQEKTAVFHCRGANKSSPGCDRVYAVQLILLPRVQVYELTPATTRPIEDDDHNPRLDIESPAVQ